MALADLWAQMPNRDQHMCWVERLVAPSVPGSVRYMMLRRISVVMTTMSRSTLRVASPVCSPTREAPKRSAHLEQLLVAQRLEGGGVDDPLPPACQAAPIESLSLSLTACMST